MSTETYVFRDHAGRTRDQLKTETRDRAEETAANVFEDIGDKSVLDRIAILIMNCWQGLSGCWSHEKQVEEDLLSLNRWQIDSLEARDPEFAPERSYSLSFKSYEGGWNRIFAEMARLEDSFWGAYGSWDEIQGFIEKRKASIEQARRAHDQVVASDRGNASISPDGSHYIWSPANRRSRESYPLPIKVLAVEVDRLLQDETRDHAVRTRALLINLNLYKPGLQASPEAFRASLKKWREDVREAVEHTQALRDR